jgi:hypothetical protein
MLLQAKALTTTAEWAQAYAELAEEKNALAKEKDAQLSVLTKENRILTNEKVAVIKEKDALVNQLAVTALGNSTGLYYKLVAPVGEALSCLSAYSLCAHCCTCDVCSSSGGRCRSRDSAEARSRSRCQDRAETRAPFELDRVQLATYRFHDWSHSPHGVPAVRSRANSNWRGAATMKNPAGAADPRRRAPMQRRGPRSVRPAVQVASKGAPCQACFPHSRASLAAYINRVVLQHAAEHAARNTAHRALTHRTAHSTLLAACQMHDRASVLHAMLYTPQSAHLCFMPCCTLHDRRRWSADAFPYALAREIVLVA